MQDAQFTDPTVSRRKFQREIREYRSMSDQYQLRGWFLVYAKYPHVRVILATPNTTPIMILCGIAFDYKNYDAVPPSVRLVHPISSVPYKFSELPTLLPRLHPSSDLDQQPPKVETQALMQAHSPDDIPFLCLEGVREYHEHPAHSGDPWELHRRDGAGRLVRLIDVISKYGSDTVKGVNIDMRPKINFNFELQLV